MGSAKSWVWALRSGEASFSPCAMPGTDLPSPTSASSMLVWTSEVSAFQILSFGWNSRHVPFYADPRNGSFPGPFFSLLRSWRRRPGSLVAFPDFTDPYHSSQHHECFKRRRARWCNALPAPDLSMPPGFCHKLFNQAECFGAWVWERETHDSRIETPQLSGLNSSPDI